MIERELNRESYGRDGNNYDGFRNDYGNYQGQGGNGGRGTFDNFGLGRYGNSYGDQGIFRSFDSKCFVCETNFYVLLSESLMHCIFFLDILDVFRSTGATG